MMQFDIVRSHTLFDVAVFTSVSQITSLAPGGFGCDYKNGIFNLVLLIGIFRHSHDNALRRMLWDLTDDKSTLLQVMAWCRQATSHYLNQCWLSSLSLYGLARPQWVKLLSTVVATHKLIKRQKQQTTTTPSQNKQPKYINICLMCGQLLLSKAIGWQFLCWC